VALLTLSFLIPPAGSPTTKPDTHALKAVQQALAMGEKPPAQFPDMRANYVRTVVVPQKQAVQASIQAAQTAQTAQSVSARAAAPTPVVAPAAQGCAAYEPLVATYTDWNVAIMMAIMQAESGCNPDAYNPSGCYGLFQVNGYGALYDPAANVAAAHQKWLSRGYLPWTTYTDGAYLKYLQ
jgi:soluble lytic murein transglycosylase-like protein